MSALLLLLRLFWRERRLALAAGMALSALTLLAGIGLLGLSGWFITATGLAGASAATALAFDVFRPSAGIRFLALLRTGARYGERLVTHEAVLGLIAGLRVRLFGALAAPGAAGKLQARPARLLFRLTADLEALDALYPRLLAPLAAAIIVLLAVAAGLAFLRPSLGLAALCLLLPALLLPWWLAREGLRPAGRRAVALEALRLRVADLLAGQTDFLLSGRLPARRLLALAAERRLAQADDRLNRLDLRAGLALGALAALLPAVALLAVGALVGAGLLSAPQAALVLLLALAVLEPLAGLRRGAVELGRTLRAAGRLAPPLAATPYQELVAEPAPAGLALELAGVTYAHPGAAHPLFRDLSLRVAVGERVAIIGPSGAGKSGLLDLATGECRPAAGTIAIAPWALLGQRTDLFQDDVRANLLLADPGADDAALWRALALAGLEEAIRALPLQLGTPLAEGGDSLSGGQRRRLALARFFLQSGGLWLLDEATEGMDAPLAREVLHRVAGRAGEHTLVLVTHLRREAALADRLIRLEGGRIVADVRRGEAGFGPLLDRLRPD